MRKPLVFILIVILFFCLTISVQEDNESQEAIFAQKRHSMIINQLQSRDITDPEVLQAMLTVPAINLSMNISENQLTMIIPLL